MRMQLILIFQICLAFTIFYVNAQIPSCPLGCICNLKSVRCIRLGLTYIPEVPIDTKILDLRYIQIAEIPDGTFINLKNLHTIFLLENKLTTINNHAFNGLTTLKHLHLSKNAISTVAEHAFAGLEQLQSLYLNNNKIRTLKSATFDGNKKLIRLRMESNLIECDCSMQWLWKLLKTQHIADATVVCNEPNTLYGRRLQEVHENEFGCDPKLPANIEVEAAPIITVAPKNETLTVGSNVVLSCEASGKPRPKILWSRNEQRVGITNRIFLSNENTQLHIEHIKESDAGIFKCFAENSVGSVAASANIIVNSDFDLSNEEYDEEEYDNADDIGDSLLPGPPTLLFEPYDIDALPGTTIELPCQGKGQPKPEVKWKKDGKTIQPSAQYRISEGGSLHIKKISTADSGRYECSLVNKYGRITSSGLLTVRNNEVISPGDIFVKTAYAEASNEIDKAINQTISSLFNKNTTKNGHHGDLFRLFRYPNAPTRELARAAEIYERTLHKIRNYVDAGSKLYSNTTDFDYKDILSTEHLALIAELSGCQSHRIIPNCTNMCYHLKYRTMDGTCNNLQNPSWGGSLTGFRRLLQPTYENGFSSPIGWTKGKLYNGFPKPSARLVSSTVISTETITQDEYITHLVMQWGQFLDHDLDHAIPSVSSESWDGIDCKKTCDYAAPCYPIEVPPSDERIRNRRCIDLVRSSAICGSGMTSVFFDTIQPREQINQLTSFIDASQVYGYSNQVSRDLRNFTTEDGLLRVGVSFPKQRSMLPFAAPTDGMDCRRDLEESSVNCFTAGDIRVNEQIGLAAMHTIWLREHNRIAEEIKELNSHWDGETVYQEARKIVGAEMQHITYKHWLPNILGPIGMEKLGEYKGYDATVNPSISNEFATAALRFGHTLINPILHRLNETFQPIAQGHLELHKAFFAPWRLVHEGGVDPLLRGMFSVPAKLKKPTENLNKELTEKLFFTSQAVALDLAAINIQRARDHGIPGYNEYRKICNLSVAETFEDLRNEISSESVREKLRILYGHPSNIDIFVGGILEDQVEGARIGPLFHCILIEQFRRLRDGDRHWYENPSTFKPEQLSQIKLATLGRVLCDNGDNISMITDNVFHLPGIQGGYKQCSEVPKMNLATWLNCDKCSAHRDPNSISFDPNVRLNIRQRRSISDVEVEPAEIISEAFTNSSKYYQDADEFDFNSVMKTFEQTINEMQIRITELETTCQKSYEMQNSCDDDHIQRLHQEKWFIDDCTQCECKNQNIMCTTEKCPKSICESDKIETIADGECCSKCK